MNTPDRSLLYFMLYMVRIRGIKLADHDVLVFLACGGALRVGAASKFDPYGEEISRKRIAQWKDWYEKCVQ